MLILFLIIKGYESDLEEILMYLSGVEEMVGTIKAYLLERL